MRAPGLQVKVTVAIVASLILIGGAGAAVAQYNFREAATTHARDEAQTRVRSLVQVIDLRLHQLGQVASDGVEEIGTIDMEKIMQDLRRGGFTAFVIVGPDGSPMREGGEAPTNLSLHDLLLRHVPQPAFPGRVIQFEDGWLVVGVRSVNHKYAIVGAIDRETLKQSFLVDVLIDSNSANVIETKEDDQVATSLSYEKFATGPVIVEQGQLSAIQGHVEHIVPISVIDASVNELVTRFVATSTLAVMLAGLATVFIVSSALQPLARITEAARRLGAGEEKLDLNVHTRDEMGVLAEVLEQSAASLAQARRAQQAHNEEMRLAAEDFQVAVGDLARSVGEAETAPEISRRLVDAIERVAPVRATIVLHGGEVRERSFAHPQDEQAVLALLQSDPEAFRWWDVGTEDGMRIALLPALTGGMNDADARKVGILVAQASLALHRARSVEMKQIFVDILSHDLKNPLAVARGRIEMAAVKFPDATERLQPAQAALDRATRIIEEAVLYSKLERQAQLDRPETDVIALVGEAAHALAPLAAQREVTIEVSGPSRAPWPANPLLCRAVENLLSNAIKWSPQGGTVHLMVEPDRDECRVLIVDHGPGIPMEVRPKLFARFQRADKTGVKGTGLGLAIAKRVVDVQQGVIEIEDTPGGGCTFVLRLPKLLDAPVVVPIQEGSA